MSNETTHLVRYDTAYAEAALEWLRDEFPDWEFTVDRTATWEGSLKPLWIARKDGHHPQAELTPAKLHTRLDDYLRRESARRPQSN